MLTGYLFVFEEACDYSIVFFGTALFIPERTRYNTEVDGGGNMAFRIVHCNINVTEAAHRLHEEMGCICFENKEMGIYFIHDPDDYWLEVVPA